MPATPPLVVAGGEAFDMTKRVVEPLPAHVLGRADTGQAFIIELQLSAWQGPWQPPFVIMCCG